MFDVIVRVLYKKCCTWIKILRAENTSYFPKTTPPCAKATTQTKPVILTHKYHHHHHHHHYVVRFTKNIHGTILVTNLAKHSGFILESTAWLTLSCILLDHYGTRSHTPCSGTKGTAGADRESGVRNILLIPINTIIHNKLPKNNSTAKQNKITQRERLAKASYYRVAGYIPTEIKFPVISPFFQLFLKTKHLFHYHREIYY